MGLISMMSLDLLAQDENMPEELKPYYEAYYKKKFAFAQDLFKNAGDPDFRKKHYSPSKTKVRPKRSKKSKEPLPWDEPSLTVPVAVYETILDSLSLSVSSVNWYNDKIDSEIKVSMHYDVPEIWKENSDMIISQSGTKQYHAWPDVFCPVGDPTIGLQTQRPDGMRFRFVSRVVDNEDNPVHFRMALGYERKPIEDIHGNCISINETYKMILDRPLSEIKSGSLYIGILNNEYRRVKVTSEDVNKQFTLGEVPFTLLSFKNGTAIISCDSKYYDEIHKTWCYIGMKNGVPLEHPNMLELLGYSYTLYDIIVNNPTYSFQEFMDYVTNKGFDEKMVCIYPFYAPVNEIYFCIPLRYNETMLQEKEIKVK